MGYLIPLIIENIWLCCGTSLPPCYVSELYLLSHNNLSGFKVNSFNRNFIQSKFELESLFKDAAVFGVY